MRPPDRFANGGPARASRAQPALATIIDEREDRHRWQDVVAKLIAIIMPATAEQT
jgi:hypothetical protein